MVLLGQVEQGYLVVGGANNDEVQATDKLFAKLMGECLQMGGGVNSKAFSRSWLQSSKVCLECSSIEFDKNIGKNSFSGFRDYLEKNKVSGTDKKYSDFFTKDESHKESWINFGSDNGLMPGKYGKTIDANEIYSVFFIGVKQGTINAVAWDHKLFDREDTYFVYAAASDKSNGVCDRKVN